MRANVLRWIRPVLVLLGVTAATAYAWQARDQWAPGVQQVADESPALAPDAALKTFLLPPDYRIELVASEPMVQDPIVVDFDPDGRMWVLEMVADPSGAPEDAAAAGGEVLRGRPRHAAGSGLRRSERRRTRWHDTR
jgi:hypothetical protein